MAARRTLGSSHPSHVSDRTVMCQYKIIFPAHPSIHSLLPSYAWDRHNRPDGINRPDHSQKAPQGRPARIRNHHVVLAVVIIIVVLGVASHSHFRRRRRRRRGSDCRNEFRGTPTPRSIGSSRVFFFLLVRVPRLQCSSEVVCSSSSRRHWRSISVDCSTAVSDMSGPMREHIVHAVWYCTLTFCTRFL